jgi:hypothetical protein
MSDTQPIDVNSAALGIGRHVSGIADPFSGHIDEFRISHVQRFDGWIETTWHNMSDPGSPQQEPRSSKAANRRRLPAPVWSPVSYNEGGHLALAVLGQRSSTVCAATRLLDCAWDDAMLACWSANPVGMRWSETHTVFL